MVFAEASWYGSIRAGIKDTPDEDMTSSSGVSSHGSRWGIKGSSEVSEGLTAVYRYERSIDATNAGEGGRLSYVGLSGGFGTISVGQIWSAAYNSVGAITDNSGAFGDSETGYRIGNAVSYAVSVGNVSLQADVEMKKNSGMSDVLSDKKKADSTKSEGKTVDAFQIGATLGGLMETGKIAVAHKRHDQKKSDKKTSNFIAAEYAIGGMTFHLGTAQHKMTMGNSCHVTGTVGQDFSDPDGTTVADYDITLNRGDRDTRRVLVNTDGTFGTPTASNGEVACRDGKKTDTTVFAGLRGGLGDTGVSYVFQVRTKKSKGTSARNYALLDPNAIDGDDDTLPTDSLDNDVHGYTGGTAIATNKHSPWILGLSRNLGGGASVHFEHGNADQDGTDNSTAVWLKVDF